jgi:hypothetical protein
MHSHTHDHTLQVSGVPMKVVVLNDALSTTKHLDGVHVSKLTLTNVQAHDSGWYICFVSDVAGALLYRSAVLTVHDRRWRWLQTRTAFIQLQPLTHHRCTCCWRLPVAHCC